MRRSTPNRYASAVESRPPFTTSTSTNRTTTPNTTPARRGVSPVASSRKRAQFGVALQATTPGSTAVSNNRVGHGRPISASRARGSPPMDDTMNAMITDLVNISHNIERYIAENKVVSHEHSPARPGLKAEEIERVVRRVEGHFRSRVEEVELIVQQQKDVILQLSRERDAWKRRAESAGNTTPSAAPSSRPIGDDVRASLANRSTALSELEKTWHLDDGTTADGNANGAQRPHDLQQLRQILVEEKRQRLLVEEQTQSLTEQHAKVVNTLELRIRKQERQLQGLMEAFEQQQQQLGVASTLQQQDEAFSNLRGTPRSLKFRQQRQLRFDEHPPTPDHSGGAGAGNSSAHSSSAPMSTRGMSSDITDVIELTSRMPPSGKTSPHTAPLSAAERTAPSHAMPALPITAASDGPEADMDDVAAFLANISRELESISSIEAERHTKIASIS